MSRHQAIAAWLSHQSSTGVSCSAEATNWPDPDSDMLNSPEFEAVWRKIKDWDIGVPSVYAGHCAATGNHVRAILDALYDILHKPQA